MQNPFRLTKKQDIIPLKLLSKNFIMKTYNIRTVAIFLLIGILVSCSSHKQEYKAKQERIIEKMEKLEEMCELTTQNFVGYINAKDQGLSTESSQETLRLLKKYVNDQTDSLEILYNDIKAISTDNKEEFDELTNLYSDFLEYKEICGGPGGYFVMYQYLSQTEELKNKVKKDLKTFKIKHLSTKE